MSEYFQVILLSMDSKQEMTLGYLKDELTTRYLINQLVQYNYNSNYVYFARHIQLHKLN